MNISSNSNIKIRIYQVFVVHKYIKNLYSVLHKYMKYLYFVVVHKNAQYKGTRCMNESINKSGISDTKIRIYQIFVIQN